jgi:LuxR family transcriptional regulator, maltose regulon positive regulatory protein
MNELFEKGCKALAKGEWEKAKQLLEKASQSEGSPEVFEELAWANWWLNNSSAVFEFRSKAYHLFLANNDNLGAARNAEWIGLDYLDFKGEFAIATGWFQRAENLLDGLEPSWELAFIKILKARLAYEVDKNIELSFKLIDETRELSKSLNIIDGEMIAGALKGFILVLEGKVSEGMPLLDEATLLAVTSKEADIKFTTIACCYLIDACERIRDYERAGQWCNNVKEICRSWDYKEMFSTCRVKYAGVLIWQGDWKGAEQELLSAAADFKVIRPLQVDACIVRLADLKRRKGEWAEAEKLLNQVNSHPLKLLFQAYLYFDKEDYESALYPAEKYLRRFPINRKAERTTAVELLLRIYLKLNNLEQAETLLNELREISGAIKTLPIKAALLSAEGIFNFSKNKFEIAKQSLEDAVDIYDKIKSSFESARTRLILAEVLVNLNQYAQAEAELNSAMTIFKQLGAQKDFDKTKYFLKNLYKNNADKTNKNIYDFTGRELEVLKLIADGKSNDEIAEKLFLSVRTVEKHITNIYGKLGVSGKSARAYVSSYAIKNKLTLT